MSLPRMRTISAAVAFLHEQDPETVIGEGFIRRRIKDGSLPCIHAGRTQLINLEALETFLTGGWPIPKPAQDNDDLRPVKCRRID